ncbi:MAG TPA: hypothetical protein VK179_04080 [Bacteroidales bacterium]|nr:hypothetical protein [Bacteroidales bacterium]
MKYSLTFTFVLLICNSIFAQITSYEGYIIKSNSDTIKGNQEYIGTRNSNRCNFIPQNSKKVLFFKPDQIKQYCIGNNMTFYSLEYNGKMTFFNLITKGKSNLYSYKDNLYVKSNLGQVTKLSGGEKIIELNGKRYIQNNESYKIQLKECVSDTSYYPGIERLNFDNNEIITFMAKYNGDSPVTDKNFKTRNRNVISLFIGTSVSKQIIGNDPIAYEPFFSYHKMNKSTRSVLNNFIGISIQRKLPSNIIDLKFSLIYERADQQIYLKQCDLSNIDMVILTGREDFESDNSNYTLQNRTEMNLSSINVPLSVLYNFSYGRIRPFAEVGLKAKICLNNKIHSTREIFKDNESYSKKTYTSEVPVIAGLSLSLGSNYIININNSIGIGLTGDVYIPSNDYFDNIFDLGLYIFYSF